MNAEEIYEHYAATLRLIGQQPPRWGALSMHEQCGWNGVNAIVNDRIRDLMEAATPAARQVVVRDGYVIQFGVITAPDGCYLLAAGEAYKEDDLQFTDWPKSPWQATTRAGVVQNSNQFCYARKLPPEKSETPPTP